MLIKIILGSRNELRNLYMIAYCQLLMLTINVSILTVASGLPTFLSLPPITLWFFPSIVELLAFI